MFTNEERTKILKKSEQAALYFLPSDTNQEDLFWMRFEVGEAFIERHFSETKTETLRSKGFWKFWRQVWHLNDVNFTKRATKGRYIPHQICLKTYRGFHEEMSKKYSLSKQVHRALLKIQQEPETAKIY